MSTRSSAGLKKSSLVLVGSRTAIQLVLEPGLAGLADKYEYEYWSIFVFIFKDFGHNFIHIHVHD